MSKCVYLASMAVEMERIVADHNHDFCINAVLMFMPAEVWGLNQSKNCQHICFCPSQLICKHRKLNKNKF